MKKMLIMEGKFRPVHNIILFFEKVPLLWKLMLRTLIILSVVLCILVDWGFADNMMFKT